MSKIKYNSFGLGKTAKGGPRTWLVVILERRCSLNKIVPQLLKIQNSSPWQLFFSTD